MLPFEVDPPQMVYFNGVARFWVPIGLRYFDVIWEGIIVMRKVVEKCPCSGIEIYFFSPRLEISYFMIGYSHSYSATSKPVWELEPRPSA